MKKFGELPRAEQLEIFSAFLDGKEIEFLAPNGVSWLVIELLSWSPHATYRIAPIKPSINWDHVHTDYNCLATDASGKSYFFTSKPYKDKSFWRHDGSYVGADVFASFKPGTCDWKDSLVVRPGYEEVENHE